jgi:hypothetical protein
MPEAFRCVQVEFEMIVTYSHIKDFVSAVSASAICSLLDIWFNLQMNESGSY